MISRNARNLSSKSHVDYSKNLGENGQNKYFTSCMAANIKITRSNRQQDISHIDFFIDGESVDVKGLKRSHRQGLILLELKNVMGYDGWCSKSGPKWIAFDFGAFFVHVKTSDLLSIVSSKCDLTKRVDRAEDCLYKAYTRKQRQDLVTMIKLEDIMKNCEYWLLPIETN